ncbi:unnamed protein product [Sphagnum balticum]
METIMRVPGELEYIEGFIKLAKRKKDEKTRKNQVATVNNTPIVKRISVNKTCQRKTMHLPIEINNGVIEGLMDTGAFMSVMAISIVQKLGIMHLVSSHETYKMASGIITIALGRLDDMHVRVSNVVCSMVFLVVDIDTYNLLLGLNFLMKIGVVVDVEKSTMQVRHGPGADVEMLPLNVVNIVQYGETQPTSSVEHIKSLDKMFQQLQMEDLLEKGLFWKGGCSLGPTILMMKDHLMTT